MFLWNRGNLDDHLSADIPLECSADFAQGAE